MPVSIICPLLIVPSAQVTVCPDAVQRPAGLEATKRAPFGSVSLIATFVADDGPWLVTRIV